MLGKGHAVLDRGRYLLEVAESLGGSARRRCEDQTTEAESEAVLEELPETLPCHHCPPLVHPPRSSVEDSVAHLACRFLAHVV